MKKKECVEKIKEECEAAKLECRAMQGMEHFPADEADEARRLRLIMEQLRRENRLTQEEEEKVFGPGGYLEQAEQRAAGRTGTAGDREVPKKRKVWHHAAKWTSVAAVFCASLVLLTISSEANRQHVADMVNYYIGDDVVVKSRSDSSQTIRDVPELEMRTEIKEDLDMEVPVFPYKPEKMKFVEYETYKNDKVAIVYYEIEGEKLVLCMSGDEGGKQNTKFYDGKIMDTICIDYKEISVDIFENVDKSNESKSYSARWERENVTYRLSGKIKKEEFYKILKKMTY